VPFVAADRPMTRVFISYARVDWEFAARLRECVAAEGHEVFLDTHAMDGIQIGEAWETQLHDQIWWADAMICIVTSAYLRSQWCSAEIAIFRWERGWLLPLNMEPGIQHPLLRSVQGADYARDPACAIVAILKSLHDLGARLHRTRGYGRVCLLCDRCGTKSAGGTTPDLDPAAAHATGGNAWLPRLAPPARPCG